LRSKAHLWDTSAFNCSSVVLIRAQDIIQSQAKGNGIGLVWRIAAMS
jgi:hypothetical protein